MQYFDKPKKTLEKHSLLKTSFDSEYVYYVYIVPKNNSNFLTNFF